MHLFNQPVVLQQPIAQDSCRHMSRASVNIKHPIEKKQWCHWVWSWRGCLDWGLRKTADFLRYSHTAVHTLNFGESVPIIASDCCSWLVRCSCSRSFDMLRCFSKTSHLQKVLIFSASSQIQPTWLLFSGLSHWQGGCFFLFFTIPSERLLRMEIPGDQPIWRTTAMW